MNSVSRTSPFAQALGFWNWKCALLSASARSAVYLAAMARTGLRGGLSNVLVEMAYVTLTAGLYAGLQQKALDFRNRLVGNLAIVPGVPGLAQALDWLIHRAAGAAAPARATLAVCVFAALSALFHLYVMRRGVFLTGRGGGSLGEDFRRIPRLAAGFVLSSAVFLGALPARLARTADAAASAELAA